MPNFRVGYQCVTHPFATKLTSSCDVMSSVRLACLRHAASIHPEPGSNSQKNDTEVSFHTVRELAFPGQSVEPKLFWNRYLSSACCLTQHTDPYSGCLVHIVKVLWHSDVLSVSAWYVRHQMVSSVPGKIREHRCGASVI